MKCGRNHRRAAKGSDGSEPCAKNRNCGGGGSSGEADSQPFPTSGALFDHLNVLPSALKKRLALHPPEALVYAYVVETAKWDENHPGCLQQTGSGPNFAGGRITLCTCKHPMRASRTAAPWPGKWIAGFSAVGPGHVQELFYLMRVEQAFESHRELWNYLPEEVRVAKSISRSRFGDVFEPKSPPSDQRDEELNFVSGNYNTSIHSLHDHQDTWPKDFDYRQTDTRGRPAPLLVGAEEDSFVWRKPCLRYDDTLGRGCKKFHLAEGDRWPIFLKHLVEIA